jgi:hypothetical protein
MISKEIQRVDVVRVCRRTFFVLVLLLLLTAIGLLSYPVDVDVDRFSVSARVIYFGSLFGLFCAIFRNMDTGMIFL